MEKKGQIDRLTRAQKEDIGLLKQLPRESRDTMKAFALGMLAAGKAMKRQGKPVAKLTDICDRGDI